MSDNLIERILDKIEDRLRAAHSTHLGYPYNLVGRSPIPAGIGDFLVNNLGDPYSGSHFASEVFDLEREFISWLRQLWQCPDPDQYWGAVGASGTEANLWALYLAREAMPSAVLLHSVEAHCSIPKAARILQLQAIAVPCEESGAISLAALTQRLAGVKCRSVIVALTCGTPMKGAHDNIKATVDCLQAHGFDQHRRFIHLDGALNAMVLPFAPEAPSAICPSFTHDIDSISTCGHKMIGTPMPCGVLIARKHHVDRAASATTHLRSNDATLMGSRNGHAVVALWARLKSHGVRGFSADVSRSLKRAEMFEKRLRFAGVPVLRNDFSFTVVFPQPTEEIVRKYQLACHRGRAHAIVMPNVTDALIQQFWSDYVAWWNHVHRLTHAHHDAAE